MKLKITSILLAIIVLSSCSTIKGLFGSATEMLGGAINGDWTSSKIVLKPSKQLNTKATIEFKLEIKEVQGKLAGMAYTKFWESVADSEVELPIPIHGNINENNQVNFELNASKVKLTFKGVMNKEGNKLDGRISVEGFSEDNIQFTKIS